MTATTTSPLLRLNNGVEMPAVGFGAMNTDASAVTTALNTGYRLIDTASLYLNEREVGQGIRDADVPRNEVFVTTKLWLSDWGFDKTLHAFDRSAGRLDVGALDLYLLHMPYPMDFAATIASYKAAERFLAEGRVRAIGVSNFKPQHLDRLLAEVDVVPAVNQVELHPYFAQRDVRAKDSELGIITQAWSPIGGVLLGRGVEVVNDPVLVGRARKHGKTAVQVVLRWHLQHGNSPIPKSSRPERIAENFDVFDFTLSDDDLAAIDRLDADRHGGPDPDIIDLTVFRTVITD